MKSVLIIIILSAFCINTKAQQLSIGKQLKSIPGNYTSFSVDILDNIYLLNASNQIKKLNANGDSVSVFNNIKKFGEASFIDVSNPLKILIYYKGFSTIAILDGMLNLKNTIDLRQKNIFDAAAVSLSYDGKIWLFDVMDNTLKKLDDEGNVIFKTSDFRQLFDNALSPSNIFDQNKYVYLYDSLQGIYIFDYYGAFKKKIDITHWEQLHISNQNIFGRANGKFHCFNIASFQYTEWKVPDTMQGYQQLFFKEKKLYALSKTGLEIYTLNNAE